MNSVNIQAFELEKLRDTFAKKGLFVKLIETYKRGNPEILNTNSSKKWDKLNVDIREHNNPMAFDRMKCLARYIKGNNLNILDYGFGQGSLERLIYKQNKHARLVGIDISSKSVMKAKKKFKEWNFLVGKIDKMKKYRDFFDYIVCSEVLEHISPSDTFGILKQFYRSLKPGGKLLMSVPMNEGLAALIEKGENPNSHTRVYTPEIIKAELRVTGFEYIQSEFLYAFHKYYALKKFITKLLLYSVIKPNVMIILAKKT